MPQIPGQIPVSLFFARDIATARSTIVPRPALVVMPTHSTWNDFGYNFAVAAVVILGDDSVEHLNLALMFEGEIRSSSFITQLLSQTPTIFIEPEFRPHFCSLMHSADDYRSLVERLGFELAVSVLRASGDAVVTRIEGTDAGRIALLESASFHLALLRRDEAYTAYRRGGSHLTPGPKPIVTDAATSFTLIAKLKSAPNRYVMDLDFAPDTFGRDRLAVLIGRNGTGKSQLLLSLIGGLRNGDTEPLGAQIGRSRFLKRVDGAVRLRPPEFSRVVVFSSTTSDIYPQDIPPWDGIDYTFFSMVGSHHLGFDALTTSLIDCIRDDLRNVFTRDRPEVFSRPFGRQELLKSILHQLGLLELIYLPLKQSDDVDLPYLREIEGRLYFRFSQARLLNEQRRLMLVRHTDTQLPPIAFDEDRGIRHLSSGETAMLRFAAQAVASVETGSLFLFDEPETHLHPNFVSDFVEILHRLLTATNSVAVAATHSAYLVRETPRRRVRVLSYEEENISISIPRQETFGASIDGISQSVFFDASITHQYQATLRAWLASQQPGKTIENILTEHGAELNSETLSYLARLLVDRRDTGQEG